VSLRETLFGCYGRVRALLLSVWLAGGIPNQNVLCGDLEFWCLGSRRIVGGGRGSVVLYMSGAVAVASGMAGPGWRIRLVQPQAKIQGQKGGGGPEDIRRYQGILR